MPGRTLGQRGTARKACKGLQSDYCEAMKNLTVSLDDETYRQARICAAEAGTSVSAMVRSFLNGLGSAEPESERLKREEADLRARITGFRAADRLGRDEVHERGA